MTLEQWGWTPVWAHDFARAYGEDYFPARISLEQKNRYAVLTAQGEQPAVLTGKLLYDADDRADLPVVGDWVAARRVGDADPTVTVHGVLPRRSLLARQEVGNRTRMQPLAANLDTLLLVVGLDGNFNLHRIERYLTVAWESGAQPVVLLTKADICPDVHAAVQQAQARAGVAPVHAISSFTGVGLQALDPYLTAGSTLALLGSSGVGKSTLLNHLLGQDVQRVQAVRADDSKGRHTTTHRQLFHLPGGALLIDTPGIRELQLWNANSGMADVFAEIDVLAEHCRYADCRHQQEPGCAVRAAVEDGRLDADRWQHYQQLQRELAFQARKLDSRADLEAKHAEKRFHKMIKQYHKERE